jgi:alpha-tubulin suppressor-like RCC1 family protein
MAKKPQQRRTGVCRVWLVAMAVLAAVATASVHAVTPTISAGNAHALALGSDGNVRSWGYDGSGQLGLGTSIANSLPVQVQGLSGVVSASAGFAFAVALKADGTVWAWGDNSFGELGDGTTADRPTPKQVQGIANVVRVSAGEDHTLALKSDGTVWAWGYNDYGQLGNGTTLPNASPTQIAGLSDIVQIAAGQAQSFALRGDGTLWAWGINDGEIGDGTQIDRLTPVQVVISNVVYVAAGGFHTLAVKSDGTVWGWGDNGNSQLGDGTTTTRLTPEQVPGLANMVAVAAGEFSSYALRSDGTVWSWGNNIYGQLGDATQTQRSTPVQVFPYGGFTGIVAIESAENHVVALKTDGTVWGWGEDGSGEVGDGTTFDHLIPFPSSLLPKAISISGGNAFSVAVTQDGNVWAWGDNTSGQLGYGFVDNRSTPQSVSALANVVAISAGSDHSVALKNDGTVWTWGLNSDGQLGNGTQTPSSTPLVVNGLAGVVGISAYYYHTAAVKSDGTVWAWGNNIVGQLGNGTTINSNYPVQVTGLANAVAVGAGDYHTIALTSDGHVWSWGYNTYGQLGNGTTANQSSPGLVSGLSNVIAISAGGNHNLAIKSDGTVWAWGRNTYGQLGDGNTNNATLPVQVTGLANVAAVSAGEILSMALKQDGTVWNWGDNTFGELGDGTVTSRFIPQQVPSLANVSGIAAGKIGSRATFLSFALRRDGTMLAWGFNDTGQMGDGTYAQRLTPVVVLNVNGAGSLQTGDWFLNLNAGSSTTIPANYVPPFEVVAAATGSDTSKTVSADVKYNAAAVGTNGSVFITASVPAGSPLDGSGGFSPFRMALADAPAQGPGIRSKSQPHLRTTAAPGTTYVQVQLTPAGWQPVVNGQLTPYVTGVLGGALASQTILNNIDITQLAGAQFCLGYGASASSMIANGTVRNVVTVAGAPAGTTVTCLPSATLQAGYWWNPAEGGRGYTIEQNTTTGNVFFATYLYTAGGSPVWYAAGPAAMSGSTFSAPLEAFSGGQTLTGNYQTPTQGASPGNVSITFTDATDATLTWPGGTIPITRYPIVPGGLTATPPATQPQAGYWWNPAEGGRGYTIEAQSNTVFVAAYMYDNSGNAVWYAAGPAALTGGNAYVGNWTTYTGGQTLTGSYHAPTGTANAGSLTIQFTSPTNGTLTLPDGRQIPIERYTF